MPRNPFAVLGIPLDASLETIKAAWRRLAREHHPDVASTNMAEERRANRRMAEINAAYHELRDPETRRRHRDAEARAARAAGEPIYADTRPPDRGWSPGAAPRSRPVTTRIDTTALLRPRNSTLLQLNMNPLPGHAPRPRVSEDREPPRASTPAGPVTVSQGPNFDSELPDLREALHTELRFGKFAGLTLGDVASLEPSYVDWIVHTINEPEVNLAARVVLRHLERSGRRRFRSAASRAADTEDQE